MHTRQLDFAYIIINSNLLCSCLSPRSAFFYEFPPNGKFSFCIRHENLPETANIYLLFFSPNYLRFSFVHSISEQGQNTSKKKTTFSRILRGLKTVRKDKHNQAQSSPRHNLPRSGVPQRVRLLENHFFFTYKLVTFNIRYLNNYIKLIIN